MPDQQTRKIGCGAFFFQLIHQCEGPYTEKMVKQSTGIGRPGNSAKERHVVYGNVSRHSAGQDRAFPEGRKDFACHASDKALDGVVIEMDPFRVRARQTDETSTSAGIQYADRFGFFTAHHLGYSIGVSSYDSRNQ